MTRPRCSLLSLIAIFVAVCCYGASFSVAESSAAAAAAWEALDNRPLPPWYDEAKFGIFIHWGLFSVPSFGSEWFWHFWQSDRFTDYIDLINRTEPPGFSYAHYVSRFKAELYQPEQWANILAQSGAQYVVLTTKHHDGFCNWNSSESVPTTWNWNSVEVGPRRDLVGDLTAAVKNTISPHTQRPIRMGLYHSLFEWFNPIYLQDKKNNFTTQHFVDTKTMPELYDLVNKYEPDLIWSDGAWEADSEYWKATEFLQWYAFNSSVASTAVWNDRWGKDTLCKHGAMLTCNDRFNPGQLQSRKWEDAFTIEKTSWGYNRNATYANYMTVKEIVHTLISVVAWNGNVLLNVGPAADGTIHPIFVDRLTGIGEWLKVNGEAIYGTRPWDVCQNETSSSVYYTRKGSVLYVHFTKWPAGSVLTLKYPKPTSNTTVQMLGVLVEDDNNSYSLPWSAPSFVDGGMTVQLPLLTPDTTPCQHAWVLALSGISNLDPIIDKLESNI